MKIERRRYKRTNRRNKSSKGSKEAAAARSTLVEMTEPYRSTGERRPLVDECMSLLLESQTLAVAVAGANYLVGSDEGLHRWKLRVDRPPRP